MYYVYMQAHSEERQHTARLKVESKRLNDMVNTVEANLACQICMDMLMKPYGYVTLHLASFFQLRRCHPQLISLWPCSVLTLPSRMVPHKSSRIR
jgi:hypothetical protein